MPAFTFIKQQLPGDPAEPGLTMTFTTDSLAKMRENFEDFLRGAGFEPEIEEEEPEFERRLEVVDRVAAEEDWMWNDAFKSKFANHGGDMDSFTILGDK